MAKIKRKAKACLGKIKHKTQTHAVAAMIKIGNAQLSSYKCGFCHQWHIGHSRGNIKTQNRFDQLLGKLSIDDIKRLQKV